jgi:FkbM family methyltransferase
MLTQDNKCLKWCQAFITNRDNNNILVFDIGHNDGDFTSTTFSIFPKCVVHAFEANPQIVSKHESNKNVIINKFGVSDKNQVKTLFVPTLKYDTKSSSHYSSLYERTYFATLSEYETRKLEIEVRTVDDYCESNSVDFIDYLKIDTEGFEKEVLLGAAKMLKNKKIAAGQFEYGSIYQERGYTLAELVKMLDSYGYNCYFGPPVSYNKLPPNEQTEEIMKTKSNDGWENIIFVQKF